MAMTDPIADMLTRLRNANSVYHEKVEIPGSKIKVAIANILKEEGFINGYIVSGDLQKVITISMKYGPNKEKVLSGLKRISQPGLRVYVDVKRIPRVLNGLGVAIVSTSHGLLTDKQARTQHVGGEVVAYIW